MISNYTKAYATVHCAKCNKTGVRLYRPYGNFYRPVDNVCNEHVEIGQHGWYVPLCMDTDGTIWGYTAGDEACWQAWFQQPEASDQSKTYLFKSVLVDGYYQKWIDPSSKLVSG